MIERLRWGLHGLILALAAVVAVRAITLGESHRWTIVLLIGLFAVIYGLHIRLNHTWPRNTVTFIAMVAIWIALGALGADASYLSVGLFLVFLTELPIPVAIAAVTGLTIIDVTRSVISDESLALLAAPILGAVISVLIGLGFRLLFDTLDEQQRLIEELQRTRSDLATSEREAGKSAERQRLARDIHDTVAQGLSSIQMLLHAAEDESLSAPARDRIAMARRAAAAALAETRHILEELTPPDLTDSNLAVALEQVGERAVAPVTFVVDGASRPLAAAVEAALLRIAQGAVANIDQHAGPNVHAALTLSWGGDTVRLDVVDDGVGFDAAHRPAEDHRSFGLATMRARTLDLGGQFVVESEPGHTAVSVSFPLSQEPA